MHVKRVRDHIQAIALAMLLALLGMQAAQAAHFQDHDPVLEQVENCVACHIATHAVTSDEPAALTAPILPCAKIGPIVEADIAAVKYAVRPPGQAPPLLLFL